MDIVLGYHRIKNPKIHIKNEVVSELLDVLRDIEYPPEISRKRNQPRQPKGHGTPRARSQRGARRIIKDSIKHRLNSSWERNFPISDFESLPAGKLHYMKEGVGVVVSMQHRTSIGTDILRFAVAHSPPLNLIQLGVFICGTSGFEEYYFGTDKRRTENMVIFEELLEYLDLVRNIVTVPILVVGIEPPYDGSIDRPTN